MGSPMTTAQWRFGCFFGFGAGDVAGDGAGVAGVVETRRFK
jgi:hypothetical protein